MTTGPVPLPHGHPGGDGDKNSPFSTQELTALAELMVTSAEMERRYAPVFRDDMDRHPNGALAGKTPLVGPVWQTTGAAPVQVVDGRATSAGTGYAFATLEEIPGSIWATTAFDGAVADMPMTVAFCKAAGGTMLDNFVHFNYGPQGFSLTVRRDGEEPFPVLLGGVWRVPVVADGVATARVGIAIEGEMATVFGPNGETFSVTDPRILTLAGPTIFWEPRLVGSSHAYVLDMTATAADAGGAESGVAALRDLIGSGFALNPSGQLVANANTISEVTAGIDPATRLPSIFFGSLKLVTSLRAAVAAGVNSIQTEHVMPPGTTLTIESGNAKETVVTGAVSTGSAAPFTTPLATALTKAHPARSVITGVPTATAQTKFTFNPSNGQFSLPNLPVMIVPGGKLYLGSPLDAFFERINGAVATILSSLPFRFKSYTTAARPSAAVVGAGSTIYDSTVGYNITSNGTAWVNGVGTVV